MMLINNQTRGGVQVDCTDDTDRDDLCLQNQAISRRIRPRCKYWACAVTKKNCCVLVQALVICAPKLSTTGFKHIHGRRCRGIPDQRKADDEGRSGEYVI